MVPVVVPQDTDAFIIAARQAEDLRAERFTTTVPREVHLEGLLVEVPDIPFQLFQQFSLRLPLLQLLHR